MRSTLPYRDRDQAGQVLGDALQEFAGREDLLVLGLTRGGVPVARCVAQALRAPLDVMVVRKLGHPAQPEFALGAIASGGVRTTNPKVVGTLGISQEIIDAVAAREQQELERREQLYRSHRSPLEVQDHCVILVDDGLATGSTMRAAVAAVRHQGAAMVVVAVPVASAEAVADLQDEADAVVCPATPADFQAVGRWYQRFDQTSDQEVQRILQSHLSCP